jgi:hypothetical protein
LKPILFPLLDDIPASEELSIYQSYFPREKLDSVEVLKHIINREYTSVNRWTKACAMYSLAMTSGIEVSNDLVAHAFNQDALLRETAIWAIYTINPQSYTQLTQRLNSQVKAELQPVLHPAQEAGLSSTVLTIQKIFFLQQTEIFAGVPGIVLAELADTMGQVSFKAGQIIISRGQDGTIPLYIVAKGTVIWQEGEEILFKVTENELLGESLILDSDINMKEAIALDDVLLYSLDKEKFYQTIIRYPKLVHEFISIINQRSKLYTYTSDQLAI